MFDCGFGKFNLKNILVTGPVVLKALKSISNPRFKYGFEVFFIFCDSQGVPSLFYEF